MKNKKEILKFSPAHRIENVKEYYFSVKLKEIAAMKAAGEDVINLGIGSPDLPPSDATVKALNDCALRTDSHGYQSYIGLPELRAGFADFYKRKYGVNLDPACEILPLMGSKEGVMHISMAFVNPGDGVLIPNPGYPTYASVSKLVGAKIINYSLREKNNWFPDFEELEKQNAAGKIHLDKVKLMWCNYPNMPTGANANMALFKRLVAFGKKHGIIICHDNPYSFILNEHPISILAVPGAKDVCIELNSMSKTFNMPGWRIGMAASNKQFIQWILRVKSNMDSGMFKGLQLAAVEALKVPDSWYKKINKVYGERRDLAAKILESIGCEVRKDQSGLFLWGRVKNARPTTGRAAKKEQNTVVISAGQKICDDLLHEKKIFLAPGFIFGSEGDNYIRISLCANKQMLVKALNKITSKSDEKIKS
ncbi:MAG: aminotransferase class I/II-fold pyridoxal phosphate-dependent enzyme [Bacteroidales bacterium]|jgi:LL-diaminopimelate aminotransferase|nr:aminotransferase class I/II-fold pyridoxal phosphate-dependent enzyme [Bacteroidales bacterium]MCI1733065.1 aminotransferase class I/II-fold pyridoxal phosphate-dependent enzyme [Bacteroidales bacterium]